VTRQAARNYRSPLSLPLLFAPVFIAVYALHFTLLRLPYFWDEGGYYVPAAWDFFRLGTLIPETTMRNAHPPLPSILLAAVWKLAGFHIINTRLFMCFVTTFALLAVFRLARMLAGDAVALVVMMLTAVYPVWFAQSTLAHADMFAAAFTLWAITFYADRPAWMYSERNSSKPAPSFEANAISTAMLFSLACLAKETAIVLPAALFLLEVYSSIRARSRANVPWLIATAFPALPLAGWYAYHRAKTGFTFGNPEFLRYNATANFAPMRVLLSLWHRLIHLTVHMNLFVPVIMTIAVFMLPPRIEESRPFMARGAVRMLSVLLCAQWIAFSVLGGALLTRYLLPAYPMVLLLCVALWRSRVRAWPVIAALSLAGFAIGCKVNPPYPFAPEDNLSYRDMIVVHQHAVRELTQHHAGATVLTAWPVLADLQRPELGYVKTPVRTSPIENFAEEEIAKAAANPELFDTALIFSTKYDPPPGGLNLAGGSRTNDKRFYDYHRDLLPGEVAARLGGRIAWEEDINGEWAALLVFPRGYDVRLMKPARLPR
jgi:4-amino-4-deoxy-L-arabinose transferase-like glycosyltransferase